MEEGHENERARIPVFASVPSKLLADQIESRQYIYGRLQAMGLEPRTVGSTDPGMYSPLHEVRTLARHCAGGIILGYRQITAVQASRHSSTKLENGSYGVVHGEFGSYSAPTPWNQLETGILFGLGMPLFVLKEEGIDGGIFDAGSTDVLVHAMPMPSDLWDKDHDAGQGLKNATAELAFDGALLRWQGLVRNFYYGCEGRV